VGEDAQFSSPERLSPERLSFERLSFERPPPEWPPSEWQPVDPAQLVRRCRQGEQAAFSDLVAYYRDRVLAFCFRFLRQRQDAEDAAQETLARACRYLPQFDESREFEK